MRSGEMDWVREGGADARRRARISLAAAEREQALLSVGEITDPDAAAAALQAAAQACWQAGLRDEAGELAQRALVSISLPAAAVLAASLGRYEFARQLVERCAPAGRLVSYAEVLREYGRRTHPERKDLGAVQWEATRHPGESW